MAFIDLSSLGAGLLQNALSPDLSKKYSIVKTENITNTTTNTFSPTISRNFDIQYNIASGGSDISTKKSLKSSQTPSTSTAVTPQILTIPTTLQSGLIPSSTPQQKDSGGVFDSITNIAVVGMLIGGAYLFFKK